MDATRPNDLGHGDLGRRFYAICESDWLFRAASVGRGGRDLKGIADFANGKRCAKNFGNAMDSKLTAGGAYVTGEMKTSFKGYYRASANQDAVLIRSFVQFDGEGETANARQRAIGGHPAELLENVCLRKDPHSSYADREGYVPFGTLVNYAGGRSDGCTSWSPSDAGQIIPMMKDKPTTLYIYPESADIEAVTQAVKVGRKDSQACLVLVDLSNIILVAFQFFEFSHSLDQSRPSGDVGLRYPFCHLKADSKRSASGQK
jgi:hypothetical protein